VTPTQIALAWLLHQEGLIAPVMGVTAPQQIDTATGAVGLKLSKEEIGRLEAPYRPREVLEI